MSKLLEAAKDVLAQWDTPAWLREGPATGVYIGALREAVDSAEAPHSFDKGNFISFCPRCKQCLALDKEKTK